MTDFWRNLEYGQQAEQFIGDWLRAESVVHLPLFQFGAQERAPFLAGCPGELPCPDFICWGESGPYFIECKRRKFWVEYAGQRVIGVKSDSHRKYLNVSRVTRTPVHYYFLIESMGVFGGEIGCLDRAGATFDSYTNFPSGCLTALVPPDHYLFGYWYHEPEELEAAQWKQQAKAGLGQLFLRYGPESAAAVMSWVESKAERVARRGRKRP
jgi:hypothetical protein